MTDYFWKGGSGSNNWNTAANWVTTSGGGTAHSTPPTASDDVYFDSNSGTDCVLDNTNLTAAYIYVESGFPHLLTTSGLSVKVVMDGLQVSQAGIFDFSAATEFEVRSSGSGFTSYVNSSSTTSNNHYIRYLIDSSPFADDTARFATTYDLNSKDYCLVDGVYGNIDRPGNLEAKAIFKDTSGGAFNSYGSVDLLAFTNNEFTSTSTNPDVYDYDKQFYFEGRFGSDSSLSYRIGENFKFGHTTVIFRAGTDAQGGHFQVPVKGDIISSGIPRGNTTTNVFNVQYHKVIIRAPPTLSQPRYCYIEDGRTLECNELVIEAGGRLYGPAEGEQVASSKIKSVKRPTVQGDWNFKQIADGIYESIDNIPTLPVTEGGTGLNTVDVGRIPFGNGQLPLQTISTLNYNTSTNTLNSPNAHFTGKLTVDGLIDPTGVVFTPQATNPESTNPQDTIWIDSETNHLFRGERDTESTVHFNVRNDEGATIPVGAPLYSKGEIGGSNRIKVGIADASDANKMPAIGLAMEEMNTTSTKDGNMILTGILNENITITSVAEQDIIYVAPHGGSAPYLTITRPTSASHLVQNVGVCVRQAATNVSQGMKVAAIGRTNDSPNCSFLMVNTESTHPQSRRLVAGTNITLTDGGAGGDLTIAASGGGGGISLNGSTTNGILTFGNSTTADVEANITASGATFSINNPSGNGSIELGGSTGGFLDLKGPFSDDYDLRIRTTGTTNSIVTNSNMDLYMNVGTGRINVTGDLNVGSGDLYVDDSTGRVGIGISSPVNLLHVFGDNSITNQNSGGAASITVEQDGTGDAALNFLLTGVQRWIVGVDNSDGDKFKIQTGGTELDGTSHVPALTIADNGDTGINQTDPQALLHIKGSENSWDKHIRLEDHDTTSYAAIVYDDQGLKLRTFDASSSGSSAPTDRFYFRNSANTSTFFVDNDGDVEIPIGSLTIGNATPTAAGGVIMDSNAVSGAGLANGAAATLFTVPTTRQAYDATIYFYDVTNGEYQVEKIIGHNTGSGVNYSTFGQVFSGAAAIGSLDAVNSSGTTLIQFTNNQGGSINYQAKISITHMEAS